MKCGAGFPSFRLFRATPALSAVLVSLCLLGCEYMNKDMLGYLRHWTETVQVGRVEVSNAAVQKDDSGADTIPVAAAPIITSYIINPQGYGLDATVGTEGSSSSTVRVSSAVLPQATVTSSDSTMMAVQLTSAADSMEHTSFTVGFVPVRTDTMQSAPEGMAVTLRYNTPSLPPARVNQVVAEDGSVSYAVVKEGELWKAAADGNLYWAWDDSVTDEKSSKFAKWFEVGGVRHLLADCKVSPETKVGTRSLFRWNTGNAGTTLAAVDGEGVSSAAVTSGTVVPAGSDVTPPGSVTGVAATYAADGTVTVTWTDPVDTDGDLQEIVVGLSGGTATRPPVVVAKGVRTARFTGIPGDGKQYTVTVAARDTSGNEGVPVTLEVLADATAPAPVTSLTARYDKATTSIIVEWRDPVDTDGDLQEVEVTLSSNAAVPVIKEVPLTGEVVSFTSIPEDRTEYTVTAVAVDARGNRSAAVTVKVVADQTGPGEVSSVDATYLFDGTGNTGAIQVKWTDPADTDGDLKEIMVTLSGGNGPVIKSVPVGNEAVTFPDILNDSTEYTITVVAVDAIGNESLPMTTTVWAAAYTVSYNANNADSGSVPSNQTKVHGVDLVLATNSGSLEREGYDFDGWDTSSGGWGTSYSEGDTYSVDADLTLYAKWKIKEYTITFDGAGGTVDTPSVPVKHGFTVPFPSTPTYSGRYFAGWAVNGQKYDFTKPVTGNMTITATWESSGTVSPGWIAYADGGVSENYDSSRTAVGIVVAINGNKATKIISLEEQSGLVWCLSSATYHDTSVFSAGITVKEANETVRASSDYSQSKYPAVYYCLEYDDKSGNKGWYLPSKAELTEVHANLAAIQAGLRKVSATEISTAQYYWTIDDGYSSNGYRYYAYGFDFNTGKPTDYPPKKSGNSDGSTQNRTRPLREF